MNRAIAPQRFVSWVAPALLTILPLVAFFVPYLNRERIGPFYLVSRMDPSYPYLTNSLSLTCGASPYHIDHPGTPLQIFGMLVIGAIRLLNFSSPICPVDDVLTHPERYLGAIEVSMQIIIAAVSVLFSLRLYRLTGNIFVALCVQVSLLMSERFGTAVANVHPELMIIPATLLYAMCFLPLLFQTRPERRFDAILAGSFFGLGVAIKLTFVPLGLLLFFFAGAGARGRFAAAAVATFVFWTLVILKGYARLVKWVVGIALHAGHYGSGEVGLPASSALLENALRQIETNQTTVLIAIIGLLVSTWIWRCHGRFAPAARFLEIVAIVVCVQIAITAKHPAEQYVLPSVVLVAVASGIIAWVIGTCNVALSALYLAMLALIGLPGLVSHYEVFEQRLPQVFAADSAAFGKLQALADAQCDVVIAHDNQSSVGSALVMGNAFVNGRFREQLARLYPGFVEHFVDGQFVSFNAIGPEPPPSLGKGRLCMIGVQPMPAGAAPTLRLVSTEGNYRLYVLVR